MEEKKLTQEVIRGECLKVPDLQREDGWKLLLCFIQREDVLSLPHHYHLTETQAVDQWISSPAGSLTI